MRGDARCHLFVERLRRGHIGPGRRQGGHQGFGITALARACSAENQRKALAFRGMMIDHDCGAAAASNLCPRRTPFVLRAVAPAVTIAGKRPPATRELSTPPVCIDKARTAAIKWSGRRSLVRERTGNVVRNCGSKSTAAPATVSGEPVPHCHWGQPGKAVTGGDPRARRPAVDSVVVRAGCLGAGRTASAPASGRSSPCGAAR